MRPDRFLRTFEILDLLIDHQDGLRLTDVSKALGVPVSSVHNLLHTMVEAEVVVLAGQRYLLGPRAVRFGARVMSSLEVRDVSRAWLEDLARQIGNDVYLAVRVGHRVMYVDRHRASQTVSLNIRLGSSLSLHATAVGKLFTAYSPELESWVTSHPRAALTAQTITDAEVLEREFATIRQDGVSISREEGHTGVVGVAVPIRDPKDHLLAAIHISVLSGGWNLETQRQVIDQARQVALHVEADLGRE
jgi:DNA-binding IclR family transcriptional regulator